MLETRIKIDEETLKTMASLVDGKVCEGPTGWRVTVPNGNVLSVQMSQYHYCGGDGFTAEIAAIGPDHEWVWEEQVRGWQTAKDVAEAMKEIAA